MITIQIPGKPIAKKRPKFFRRGNFVGAYNPQESEEGKWLWYARQQIPCKLSGPVSIKTVFYMPRPKSHYGSGKNKNVLKNNAPSLHASKPDIDNLQKMIFDCLNGVAWDDDACVFESYGRKEYSSDPRTEIIISEVV